MLKVNEVVPPTGIVAAPKDLVILGGATTVMLAVAVPPVPPSVEAMAPVVFVFNPAAVPSTLTENVQDPPAATDAPLKLTTLVASVPVIVPPPQVPVSP